MVESRIYVASLSDYNAGRLVGVWLDAAVSSDVLAEGVQAMLAGSPSLGAEEWAIHDYEGFGPLRLSEYENLETVSAVALGIAEHGPAFAHWAALVGTSETEALGRFEDAYLGHADSIEDYAEGLLDDLGYSEIIKSSVPDFLQPYVKLDVEGFARDLELSGDLTVSAGDGGVYVFEGHL
ncbi:MAG TPA: antirestriction protein ArdA [Acidimicrobiales bacterium]|nr:antirestriction protein ArdA [Acidimicrobiales bacterium]